MSKHHHRDVGQAELQIPVPQCEVSRRAKFIAAQAFHQESAFRQIVEEGQLHIYTETGHDQVVSLRNSDGGGDQCPPFLLE